MRYKKTEKVLKFTGWKSGLNTVDAPLNVKDTAVVVSRNAITSHLSVKRRPGMEGFSLYNKYTRMLDTYLRSDGTDTLLQMISGGLLYSIHKETGVATLLNNGSGTSEAYGVSFRDKHWICNSSEVLKVEGSNVYQVGITAPSGATATGQTSGGSLADGTYQVYASYGRGNDLYSQGEDIGPVTISGGGGSGSIDITFPNSSDPQVSNKIIWMSDANGSTYYRYYTTDDNTTTSFTIQDDTNKNSASIYSVQALLNYTPPAFEYMIAHDNRLWGSVGDTLYYSLKAGTVYDLERFNTQANGRIIVFPHQITGIFNLGENLYVNTPAGIYVLPQSDPSIKIELIEHRYHFYSMRTVDYWSGGVIGLTQDGVRLFDGASFVSYELSAPVKTIIEKIYSGKDLNHIPCGIVYRRDNRTEYHLSFRDLTSSSRPNNTRLILDLDRVSFYQNGFSAPWDLWEVGANYMCVDNSGDFYGCQSHYQNSVIYKERTNTLDYQIYDNQGAYQSDEYDYDCLIRTPSRMPSIMGQCKWIQARIMAEFRSVVKVKVVVPDYSSRRSSEQTAQSTTSGDTWGTAVFGTALWGGSQHELRKLPFPRNLNGSMVYVEIKQNGDDVNYELLLVAIVGILTESRFT